VGDAEKGDGKAASMEAEIIQHRKRRSTSHIWFVPLPPTHIVNPSIRAPRRSYPLFNTTVDLPAMLTRPRYPMAPRTEPKRDDSPAHDHSVFMSASPIFRPLQFAHSPSSLFLPSFDHIQSSPLSSGPSRFFILQCCQIRCDG